ncbi:MAG TPA: cupin domain-containing protein [Rhodothermales bacterium]|nr:cupin domain-containing protein [Rhodothermales bacterium]
MEPHLNTAAESAPTIQETPRTDDLGARPLARGRRMAMRLWVEDESVNPKPPATHEYEIVGFVCEGTATVEANGHRIELDAGDSYCIPPGVTHMWTITSAFRAIEVTSPPAQDVAPEVSLT